MCAKSQIWACQSTNVTVGHLGRYQQVANRWERFTLSQIIDLNPIMDNGQSGRSVEEAHCLTKVLTYLLAYTHLNITPTLTYKYFVVDSCTVFSWCEEVHRI